MRPLALEAILGDPGPDSRDKVVATARPAAASSDRGVDAREVVQVRGGALVAIARLQGDGSDKRAALERQLRRARHLAEHAFAQYDRPEPGNRLVCEVLEQRWNAKPPRPPVSHREPPAPPKSHRARRARE